MSSQLKCYLCNNLSTPPFSESIFKCGMCGLYFVYPQPDSKELIQSYNQNKISPMDYYLKTKDEDKHTFKKRLTRLVKYLPEHPKILDIGTNIGTLMEVAKELGMQPTGLDINESAINVCKMNGMDVICADVDSIDFDEKFDLIVMGDFIEHIRDPINTLKTLKTKIKTGGYIFMTTPDVSSLSKKILGKKWPHFKPKEHLFYYNKKTLSLLAIKSGYRVVFMKKAGRYRKISTILNKINEIIPGTKWLTDLIPFKNTKINFYIGDEYMVLMSPELDEENN